ncbi:E3 ubiquitin-protein ligase NHLRC1 [Oryzias melastigma]|uniref:RING-type E3 ubiquitin transferase n=1 Tax=Oryzias melastigma TaxID=30732 RepID=A0A834FTA7_ORYME|nr:E3 ubiquitin-protein ligase NHLRC1 [Oryzias melastigma]KAF6739560.1 E3 ubiquitin-protein ligase NHLRC1 [Oryzias melastigma]
MDKSPGLPGCSYLNPERTLGEIQINLLECKVCFEPFNSQQRGRRPQNLSCGHVLCLECITALSHPLLGKLECPFCRQLCSVDSTSPCQALNDLQELVLSRRPSSPDHPRRTSGLTGAALQLQTSFGGWGTLVNPTGIAALGSSGTLVIVHDGEKRVVVFSLLGRKLHSFGKKGKAVGEICYPMDVAVTPAGYIVVTDPGDRAVKVFTSRGNHLITIKDSLQLPWGVDTHISGHLLVSDAQAGILFRMKVDYTQRVIVESQKAISDLQCPRAVACCRVTGNTAVMEHPTDITHPTECRPYRRLRVFTKDFHLLYQTDSFSLTLQSTVQLNMSAVIFDGDRDVIVTDADQGLIWSLGKLKNGPVLAPLVGNHLIRPVGLVLLNDMLITLDGGDHTVKIFSNKLD